GARASGAGTPIVYYTTVLLSVQEQEEGASECQRQGQGTVCVRLSEDGGDYSGDGSGGVRPVQDDKDSSGKLCERASYNRECGWGCFCGGTTIYELTCEYCISNKILFP